MAFNAEDLVEVIETHLASRIVGRDLDRFRPLAQEFDNLELLGRRLHTAIRYGLSQAFLDAVARARHKTMAEVVAQEYDLPLIAQPIAIFAQSGDQRHRNVDKMLLKRVDVLPHGLINNVRTKLGQNGELLLDLIRWIKARALHLAGEHYRPTLHFDVYGTIGLAFCGDTERMADYIGELEESASPWGLHIEMPMIAASKEGQIQAMRALRHALCRKGIGVLIVVDEWCNTLKDIEDFIRGEAVDMVQVKTPSLGSIHNSIEAVVYTKSQGVRAYLGGSCNETDRSAQVCAHVAIATQPDQMLAKPGMGVDEGLMTVYNEMQRTLAIIQSRQESSSV
jgi:methylaspartate ammonia-lyase